MVLRLKVVYKWHQCNPLPYLSDLKDNWLMTVIEKRHYRSNRVHLIAIKDDSMNPILDDALEVLTDFYLSKNKIMFSTRLLKKFIKEQYNLDFTILEFNKVIINEYHRKQLVKVDCKTVSPKMWMLSPDVVQSAHEKVMIGLVEIWNNKNYLF